MCGSGSAKCPSLDRIITNIKALSRLNSSEMFTSQERNELIADTVKLTEDLISPDENGEVDPRIAQEISVHMSRIMQLLLETSFRSEGLSGDEIQNKISNDIDAIQQSISECQ
ncbi:hypothetical protein H6F88_31510 [Oculatella sp. FACHB-28]|uniref:hypothetical protein n=1 Tax=Oculatella sp. FACHB-28 TaxID=2692845 RepID=UPI001685CEB0|nr:hypothetical protein [Oculatella sp. FACHB-28]MBD2060472.1 hypothetical protein [Oculatella sp. FACHB-28]